MVTGVCDRVEQPSHNSAHDVVFFPPPSRADGTLAAVLRLLLSSTSSEPLHRRHKLRAPHPPITYSKLPTALHMCSHRGVGSGAAVLLAPLTVSSTSTTPSQRSPPTMLPTALQLEPTPRAGQRWLRCRCAPGPEQGVKHLHRLQLIVEAPSAHRHMHSLTPHVCHTSLPVAMEPPTTYSSPSTEGVAVRLSNGVADWRPLPALPRAVQFHPF
eukprot:TRINITY_DN10340_c0_g1_i1.p1 TRINITY_DN10340_c0_g1~~TRINITY_DN10340_c0_g1_i1.p1  ORF type:complete len:213 (+),score=2.48 TRINITY_DN10340_c0_g1_i1:332-970(+)